MTSLLSFILSAALSMFSGDLPDPLDPFGAWFCCDSAGQNCVFASAACSADEWLLWCERVGVDATTLEKTCLD